MDKLEILSQCHMVDEIQRTCRSRICRLNTRLFSISDSLVYSSSNQSIQTSNEELQGSLCKIHTNLSTTSRLCTNVTWSMAWMDLILMQDILIHHLASSQLDHHKVIPFLGFLHRMSIEITRHLIRK